MASPSIFLGTTRKQISDRSVGGDLVTKDGCLCYRISSYDRMRPFFMSIVSSSDHWLFISSNGGLTAGRRNPDHALFPYYTDDKIHDSAEITGSRTVLLVERPDGWSLWQPFSQMARDVYRLDRNLYKSVYGNRLCFEEVNHDLGLTFEYTWTTSDQYGFVKRSRLRNDTDKPISLRLLDGLANLLPYGVNRAMQTSTSTLLDAYKKNELDPATGLGIFRLSSIPVDRPEPSEALCATTVWSEGLPDPIHLLCNNQLDAFCDGMSVHQETDIRAERGAYFVHASLSLSATEERDWTLVADVDQDADEIALLLAQLQDPATLRAELDCDVARGTAALRDIVASADGLQTSSDHLTTARHFANVLFNVMRGGLFDQQYGIPRSSFVEFLTIHNRHVAQRNHALLASLPEQLTRSALLDAISQHEDPQFRRLCSEYLPLTFSRRHGDPSRPWNTFSIEVRKPDGSRNLFYQGNWRDIFQNWEALAHSYPGFVEAMISKFLNASTADGYNPYRITSDGIDWETIEPDNPWSFIGYWGDHQVIYLLKLLEISRSHYPDQLVNLLTSPIFAYANVPYRIRPYDALVADPHRTIRFDHQADAQVAERVSAIGADGRLIWDARDQVYLVNLTEKLLVLVLAKLSNLILEAGIWMNTQRPEWNDANNALVGYGTSVVTLCYLRRFLQFAAELLQSYPGDAIEISEEVARWWTTTHGTLNEASGSLHANISDADRKRWLDRLGQAAGDYREAIYARGFCGTKTSISVSALCDFFELSRNVIDHSIQSNRRPDGLFHAYNLMTITKTGIAIRRLYEMLEGQVAALSCGLLSPRQSLALLEALRQSPLYREDQLSYLLYPDRMLPRFLEKNRIPSAQINRSAFLQKLIERGDRQLVTRDVHGVCHFHGSFRNADHVREALARLADQGYGTDVEQEGPQILELWETLFDHRSYTGRSGTFFGYEGLGCIYWHMVSKLLLAIQETYFRAVDAAEELAVLDRLADCYYEVRQGLGVWKNPLDYGAFPIDPYSHTPGNAGVQQPGLTGQVKEDILCRWGELGVRVIQGAVRFQPGLLRASEFLPQAEHFSYIDREGVLHEFLLPAESLAFTYCQLPVVYHRSDRPHTVVHLNDGSTMEEEGLELDLATSGALFARDSRILRIDVRLQPGLARH